MLSADQTGSHADLSFSAVVEAYFDCRRTKRNTDSARTYEQALEHNLYSLYQRLIDRSYRPGRSICFVITRPKPREVWAAAFEDRIVHHLLYNHIGPHIESTFIADSCACIPGRGTLYAARRLEQKVRSITHNWKKPAYYLKCDVANFFVAIDKGILAGQLTELIPDPWWRDLALRILHHDPRADVEIKGHSALFARIPPHKSLFNQGADKGLPIGNLSSQFFANIYLDALDQHVKHTLRARHYIRYVDDFVLLHESARQLNDWHAQIRAFLADRLALQLNPVKTILQPAERGIDFVGQVIKPWRRTLRRRTYRSALARVTTLKDSDLYPAANSYFGLLRQATRSHHDRARLAQLLRKRGHAVDFRLTKTYRKRPSCPAP